MTPPARNRGHTMLKVLKNVAPVFPVLAIVAVYLSVSGVPVVRSRSEALPSGHAGALAEQPARQTAPRPELLMESFRPTITELGTARATLLQRAAQEPNSIEELEAASQAYRVAILRLRGMITQLEQDFGPDEAQRRVGMMMYQAMYANQQVLAGEMFGSLQRAGAPCSDGPEQHADEVETTRDDPMGAVGGRSSSDSNVPVKPLNKSDL
jgi:hypothetical protein